MDISRTATKVGAWVTSPKVRSSVLFFAGLGLTIHEGLTNGPERPAFYVLYAVMMGVNFVPQKNVGE